MQDANEMSFFGIEYSMRKLVVTPGSFSNGLCRRGHVAAGLGSVSRFGSRCCLLLWASGEDTAGMLYCW
uniref:Uncharacterized protein n=1 Tax=Solanum lycopersicum TaxID=4081 RepID=A0A3Q7F3H2_SOLLC